jgi:2-polyprenyl-6-methoxyphenol hydroxylase-like FAD-dependent oxidoreductase
LRRYARSRAEPIALMLNLTHGLQKAFETHSDPSVLERLWRSTRELGWRGVNQLPPLKQAMIRHAS